jgi:hypothetical protein
MDIIPDWEEMHANQKIEALAQLVSGPLDINVVIGKNNAAVKAANEKLAPKTPAPAVAA